MKVGKHMSSLFKKLNYKWLFVIAVISIIIVCLTNRDLNQDVWFMLNHGRYILSHGFTNIEPFTVHTNMAFSFEKWLSCIIFYKLYEWFGMIGLDVLAFISTIALFFIVYKLCLHLSINVSNTKEYHKEKAVLLALIAILLTCFAVISKRPSMFSNIIFALEVLMLEKFCTTTNWKYLISLPILSFVLIQVHSTIFPVFVILMLPYFFFNVRYNQELKDLFRNKTFDIGVKQSFKKFFKHALLILGTLIVSVGAACINPYGVHSIVYTVNSMALSNYINIQELSKLSLIQIPFFVTVVCLIVVFVVKLVSYRSIHIRHFLLFFGLCFMTFYALRNVTYLFFIGVSLLSIYEFKLPLLKKTIILFTAMFIIVCLMPKDQIPEYTLLQKNKVPKGTKVMSNFDMGSQLEFYGYRTYWDTRAEVFIKEINHDYNYLLEAGSLMQFGIPTIEEFQNKYNFEYYYVQKNTVLNDLIKNYTNYTLVDKDDETELYKVQ